MKCFNHYFKPTMNIEKEGKGNCLICKPDDDNKNCSAYMPINITIHGFEVVDDILDDDTTKKHNSSKRSGV